jgi:hypothetical protein
MEKKQTVENEGRTYSSFTLSTGCYGIGIGLKRDDDFKEAANCQPGALTHQKSNRNQVVASRRNLIEMEQRISWFNRPGG